jgi:hypothetical protein
VINIAENLAKAAICIAEKIPVIAPAATILKQFIVLCDNYKFNKEFFLKLKNELEQFYLLCFGENGMKF